MALSYSIKRKFVMGNAQANYVAITGDGTSYSNGLTLSASDCGLPSIDLVIPSGCAEGATEGFLLSWDDTNSKLKAYKGSSAVSTSLDQVAAADLNGVIMNVLVISAGGKP